MIDPEKELGIVFVTNFPGKKTDDASDLVARELYQRFAGKSR
ncbi:hypothetical protein [Candidatus Rhodoblastus alkanivorans]|nr:hypothetical protein [Candidatus Rhodoblastus alkanivorans]